MDDSRYEIFWTRPCANGDIPFWCRIFATGAPILKYDILGKAPRLFAFLDDAKKHCDARLKTFEDCEFVLLSKDQFEKVRILA